MNNRRALDEVPRLMKLITLLTLSVITFTAPQLVAAELSGRVIRVLDGDTIEVLQEKTPVRVRLLNIDAPEKAQPYGSWSTDRLKEIVAGKPVTVTYTDKDRYGRILGRVVTAGGTDANHRQVETGAAWVYTQYNSDPLLPSLQRKAQSEKRGLWRDSNPVPPWKWRHKRN